MFEVGAGAYAPVTLAFTGVNAPGDVTVKSGLGDHPNLASSTLPADRSVNRTWSVASTGVAFDHCDATFHFTTTDIDPAADPDSFAVRRYAPPGWSMTATGERTP